VADNLCMDRLRPPVPLRARLRRAVAAAGLLVAVAAAAAPSVTPAPKTWPPLLQELHEASLDDPELSLSEVRRRARAPGVAGTEAEFWLVLAAARLEILLEADQDAVASLARARSLLEARPQADTIQRTWLLFMELRLRAITEGSTDALQSLLAARVRLQVPADSVLACEWDETESWVLREMGSHDEAWRATEALERCAAATGWPHYRAQALADRAAIAGRAGALGLAASGGPGPVAGERVAQLFEEAYDAVGPGPGRFLRSLLAYSAGTTLAGMDRHADAARQLQRALAASRALGDRAGIAAALTAMASLDQKQQRHEQALQALAEAEPVLRRIGTGNAGRLMALYTQRLHALAALQRRAELPGAIAGAEALPVQGVQPAARSELARAVAEAQAVLGRHAQAYEAMRRAHALEQQSRNLGSAAQVLRLQTLYDNSRREAELAALRHAEEAARLSLQAQQATARTLWAALVAAAVLVAGAGALGWRQWQRRRELAELALRDTLTGLPNRRAIEAYARAQLEQARRLNLPFTLALIDLDHFKAVNDRHGHTTGDAVLRVFAQAVPAPLRAPDRLGRWGGEEFLLVLPGTSLQELSGLFTRLRSALGAAQIPGLPQPHGCSFSMGGAEAGRDGAGFEALVEAADARLYQAKSQGRDRLG
jgi:diguanylate cyclase (GGDEF)-like protein